MTQTFTTRFTAFILAAVIVASAWTMTVTVPAAVEEAAIVTAVA